ncbi:MAG: radical SAM protein [Candidatus Krumholzibacteriia bacterium]
MLLVNEIYPAICGESRFSGQPCTLVRLTGCHLRCVWCDSEHSFQGGQRLGVPAITEVVRGHGFRTVLVTGGEPLLQAGVKELLAALLADGRTVLLETSGTRGPSNAVPLVAVPAGVHRIVDLKAPGSGIAADLLDWEGIAALDGGDELKIVCADRADYAWGRDLVRAPGRLPAGVPVVFSPVQDALAPRDLAEWILADGLDVRLQIQLHKAVWPERTRGV